MALLVEYKCKQKIPSIYQLSTRKCQACNRYEQYQHARYKTQERERDEQSQILENYFEVRVYLLYVPAFNTMKNFHYNQSCKITRCHNTYNELPQELLDPQITHLFPQEQHTHAHLPAEATRLQFPNQRGGTLMITSLDHKNNSQQMIPRG